MLRGMFSKTRLVELFVTSEFALGALGYNNSGQSTFEYLLYGSRRLQVLLRAGRGSDRAFRTLTLFLTVMFNTRYACCG